MKHIQVTNGLVIPISGTPEQIVGKGSPVSRAALPGDDYIGLEPTMSTVLAVLGMLDDLGVDPENIRFDDFGERESDD